MRPLIALLLIAFVTVLQARAEDADIFRDKGIAALKESQSNPRAIVEAARNFVKAADLYSAAGNDEKSVEMNSFLYWCKKKMSMQDIDAFVQGGEVAVSNKLTAVEKLAPTVNEAQAFFDRAEQFAQQNPAEHLLIAIRFYEVADRFKGSDSAFKAMDRSLKEQLQDKSNSAKSSAPPVAVALPKPAPATGGSQPVPAPEKLKDAEKTIKDLFKTEYAQTDSPAHLALVAKLLQQADENKNDPAAEFVLLRDARDFAVAAGDAAQAANAHKRLCDAFKLDFTAILADLHRLEPTAKSADAATALATLLRSGADDALEADNFDQAARFNSHVDDLLPLLKDASLKTRLKSEIAFAQALKRDSTPALAAVKTLTTKPDDPEANLIAGKFALERGRFDQAFALLAKGKDAALSSVAKRELTPPTEAAEQVQLADNWFEHAEKEPYNYLKTRMQERAALWYGNALPALAGLAKLKVETRLKTMHALLTNTESRTQGAKVIITETMGYTVSEFVAGVSSHNNEARPIKKIPPQLEHLNFTQLVVNSTGPINVKVARTGRVYVMPFHSGDGSNKRLSDDGFARENYTFTNGRETFDVWSRECAADYSVDFKGQVMIGASEVVKPETKNSGTPGTASPTAQAKPATKAKDSKSLIDPYSASPIVREWSERLNKLDNWTIKNGNWTQEENGIVGSDASEASLKVKLPQVFIMEFTMNIRKGMRPRMYFGAEAYFGNEGYSKGVALQSPQHGTPVNYENGQELNVRVIFDKKTYEFFVDETSVGKGTRVKPDKMTLRISGGDSWSRGEVLYSKFKLLPGGNN